MALESLLRYSSGQKPVKLAIRHWWCCCALTVIIFSAKRIMNCFSSISRRLSEIHVEFQPDERGGKGFHQFIWQSSKTCGCCLCRTGSIPGWWQCRQGILIVILNCGQITWGPHWIIPGDQIILLLKADDTGAVWTKLRAVYPDGFPVLPYQSYPGP